MDVKKTGFKTNYVHSVLKKRMSKKVQNDRHVNGYTKSQIGRGRNVDRKTGRHVDRYTCRQVDMKTGRHVDG